MKGKIVSPGYYSDKTIRLEIGIYDNSLPHRYGERLNYTLRVNEQTFTCGVNSTEQSGIWIGPDLYDIQTNDKIRLSEVLMENGFSKNEEIEINYTPGSNELEIISLQTDAGRGNIRSTALAWYLERYGKTDKSIFASKLYNPQESWTKDYVWFLQIPLARINEQDTEYINLLCQDFEGSNDFFHLRVPAKFLQDNIDSFDTVKNNIAIYLSPKAENFLVELRGKRKISFKEFLQNL